MKEYEIVVDGDPKTQGSLKAILPRNATRPVLIDDNAKALRPWRRSIVQAAKAEKGARTPLPGPIAVRLAFRLPAPAVHAIYPAARPDLDKLIRAVLDALTVACVWGDDGQVVQVLASKVYAPARTPPGVTIEVHRVD